MRTKHTFRLPPELAKQLADYAGRKRLHQAFVVETALTSFLSPDNSERMEAGTVAGERRGTKSADKS
jgi:predicted transcriptional regulator